MHVYDYVVIFHMLLSINLYLINYLLTYFIASFSNMHLIINDLFLIMINHLC